MKDVLGFLLFPCIAAVIFVGIHTWLGLQVLRRKVVFADLALAQLSALGATVAVAAGHAPLSSAAFVYALAFASVGALLLALLRVVGQHASKEALIGVLYVATTALTVLVIDRSPQGAEHVKKMLVGNVLTISGDDVLRLAMLYGAIAALHFVFRRQLLLAANSAAGGGSMIVWDLVFYGSFGVVVTSSVGLAGVLLVFSFLIVPAVIGLAYSAHAGRALAVGWGAGIGAVLVGFGLSLLYDFPTGPSLVVAFALTLALALLLRGTIFRADGTRPAWRKGLLAAVGAVSGAVLLQSAWLMAVPEGDHPLLALLERIDALEPRRFMTEREARLFDDTARNEARRRHQVEQLRDIERAARWQGDGLSEEQLQRLSAFQKSYNEMAQGEKFVQDRLRSIARSRSRWVLGAPAAALSFLGLCLSIFLLRRAPRNSAVPVGGAGRDKTHGCETPPQAGAGRGVA